MGVVQAKDGAAIPPGRVLGMHVDCDSFQDARAFLTKGGQRGPQLSIIPPGTYRINTDLFSVREVEVTVVPDNAVGIVTTTDGIPLTSGSIAGPEVPGHRSFQDGEAFINNGGQKGLQEQVLLAGTYFINPLFATVKKTELTAVPIAHVGVVIAFVGKEGHDVSGEEFLHGNLVSRGERGVWADPLEPGKYPINIFTHKVELVPTANVVLNWADAKTESHQLDKDLCTITVRSVDGYTFNLDVSQIIHVPHNQAPRVIARFGSMANLVTQVLEPTIGNYFRNAAQNSDVIEFLNARQERQQAAREAIQHALEQYNVQAVDTLIGDITPPKELMETLTDRKLAQQQELTFKAQQASEVQRRQLQEAKANADTQADVVSSQRQIEIAEAKARAAVNTAKGDAESAVINARADAEVTQLNGAAEAGRILAIGNAEATVLEQKTKALEAGNYAVIEVAKALSTNQHPLVPEVVMGANGGGNIVDLLLLQTLRKNSNGGSIEVTDLTGSGTIRPEISKKTDR